MSTVTTGALAGFRAQVADLVRDAAPAGWQVFDHAAAPDGIGVTTVFVLVDTWSESPVACGGVTVGLVLWVVAAATDPGPADDELDAAADVVRGVLRELDTAATVTGQRGTWADTNPAYRVEAEVTT